MFKKKNETTEAVSAEDKFKVTIAHSYDFLGGNTGDYRVFRYYYDGERTEENSTIMAIKAYDIDIWWGLRYGYTVWKWDEEFGEMIDDYSSVNPYVDDFLLRLEPLKDWTKADFENYIKSKEEERVKAFRELPIGSYLWDNTYVIKIVQKIQTENCLNVVYKEYDLLSGDMKWGKPEQKDYKDLIMQYNDKAPEYMEPVINIDDIKD